MNFSTSSNDPKTPPFSRNASNDMYPLQNVHSFNNTHLG